MTFSDPAVAKYVNEHFVAAWHNRAPGFHDTDYQAENEIFEHSHEAYLTRNICTFFLSADGRVFHYAAGSYAPRLFLEVLRTARELREAGFDEDVKLKPDGARLLAQAHAGLAARKNTDSWQPSCDQAQASYRDRRHQHTARCASFVVLAQQYFKRVHASFAGMADPPKLDDVRYKYLYGNSFTEETPGATPIDRDPTLERFK